MPGVVIPEDLSFKGDLEALVSFGVQSLATTISENSSPGIAEIRS